jgi:hypothetical protein
MAALEDLVAPVSGKTYLQTFPSQCYCYAPLGSSQEFRLLFLEPGIGDSVVCCSLKTHYFSSHCVYEALSYTWGENNKNKAIKCDGNVLSVTSNLYSALRWLRNPDTARVIWIDALCINQDDIPERNSQVAKMSTIYSNAFRVVIWLGDEMDSDVDAFNFIANFDSLDLTIDGDMSLQVSTAEPQLQALLAKEMLSGKSWNSINQLLNKPWFRRAWIIQEVCFATRAKVVCGTRTCDWQSLAKLILYVDRNFLSPLAGGQGYSTAKMMIQLKPFIDDEEPFNVPLFTLLRIADQFYATDPRDQVFALLGLQSNPSNTGIEVDYTIPCEELYRRVTSHCATDSGIFVLLSRAGLHRQTGEIQLPSWVVDWNYASLHSPANVFHGCFNQGYKAALSTESAFTISTDQKVLSILGIEFDTVQLVAQKCFEPQISTELQGTWEGLTTQMKHERNVFSEWDGIVYTSDTYPTGQQTSTLYCHLLSCGRIKNIGSADILDAYNATRYVYKHVEEFCAKSHQGWDYEGMVRPVEENMKRYLEIFNLMTANKRLCRSSKGYLGWVNHGTVAGDLVCIFHGAQVFYILRPQSRDSYKLVGECYLHGIMDGEVMELMEHEDQIFNIV